MVLSNLPPQPFIYFPQSQPPGIVAEGSCVPLFQTYNVIGQANALLLDLQLTDIRRRFTIFPGNPSIVLELYTLLKNYPQNINVSLLLAEIQYSLGFPQVAIDTLQHIIQNIDHNNIKARFVLAKIYKLLNIPTRAELIFREILKLAPNSWEALEELCLLILDNRGTVNDILTTFRFVEARLYSNLLLIAPDKTRKLFDLHARSAELYMLLDDIALAYHQIDKALTLAFGGTSLREMILYTLNYTFIPGTPIPLQMRHPDEIGLIRSKLFPHTGGRLPAAIAYTSHEEQAQFLTAVVQVQLQLVELIMKKPLQINKFIPGMEGDNLTHLGILILYLAIALQPHPLACRKLADLLNTTDARQTIVNAQGVQSVYTGQLLAAEYYKKAYEFDHKDVKSCKKFAKCLFKLHHYQDALTIYEILYRSMPTHLKYRKKAAQCNLGIAAQMRLAKSPCKVVLAYCERALDIDPHNLMAWCSYWNHATYFCDWRGRSVTGQKPGEYWYVDDQNKLVRTSVKPSLLMEKIQHLVDIELEQGSHFGDGIINQVGGLFAFLQNVTSGLDASDPLIRWLQRKISTEGWTESSQPFKNEGGWILRMCDKITKHVQRRWYIDSYGPIVYAGQFDNQTPIQITNSAKSIYKRPKIPSILPEPPNTGLDPFSSFTYNLTPRQVRLISHRMALEVSYKIHRYNWLPEYVIPPPPPPPIGGRLKIGYVSGDLRHHALGILMQSVFGFHDRTEFEVYGYALWDDECGESEVRKKIKAGCDHWFEVSNDLREDYSGRSRERAVAKLVKKIHEDGIHILFNLNGYTAHDLNELFAVRVAPIQVAHSFAASCGSGWMDYFIGDKIACPPTAVQSSADLSSTAGNRPSNAGDIKDEIDPETTVGNWVFTEKLIYMPHSYFVNDHKQTMTNVHHDRLPEETWRLYQQERFKRRHELFPWMDERSIILACFNQLYKLDPATFKTWLNILIRCPTAYLWLVKFSDSGDAFENLKQTATEWAGLDVSNRIIVTGCAPPEEHIARGCVADLFLDTPQVNAHTTACDILWPGTPILTLPGDEHRMASRVARSVTTAAFIGTTGPLQWQKLITRSLHEYEERAVELVQSLRFEELVDGTVMVVGELVDLKRVLVLGRGSSRLFDTERWVRNLEKGLKEAWKRWVAGTEGGNIEIAG